MPGVMIERPKMTRTMYKALKKHIMREREKKKQEKEHDEALERMKKERELRKKKEEEDTLSLEQSKEQLASGIKELETKLEVMKQEKHKLFSELKKVLHQEDESRKRAQMKEHSDLMSLQQQYPQGMPVSGHPMFVHGHMAPKSRYMTVQVQQQILPGMKRARSPSPPPGSVPQPYYPQPAKYTAASYASGIKQEQPYPIPKSTGYPTPSPSTHVTYVTQSGLTYQPSPSQQQTTSQQQAQQQQQQQQQYQAASHSPGPGKYPPPGQSAFSAYPAHFTHQQRQISDHYGVQRVSQAGYMGSPHTSSSMSLQQQLEQANQKSGFTEDKYKMQQPGRGVAPITPQHPHMMQGQIAQGASPQTPKGSIVTGYPVRTQATTASYQPPSSQGVYSTPPGPGSTPRHSYANQVQGRFY